MGDFTDQELADVLCEIEEGLNDWEVEFVESIAAWMKWNDSLTDGQREKAREIYDEKG